MKSLTVVALLALASPAFAQLVSVQPVTFRSEIRQFVISGEKTQKRVVFVSLTADAMVVTPYTPQKGEDITIPYASMTSVIYDRRSKMRKMAPTYGKAQDHFLTVQYATASGAGDFIEIEMGKNVAPALIATLHARSGKTIERIVGS